MCVQLHFVVGGIMFTRFFCVFDLLLHTKSCRPAVAAYIWSCGLEVRVLQHQPPFLGLICCHYHARLRPKEDICPWPGCGPNPQCPDYWSFPFPAGWWTGSNVRWSYDWINTAEGSRMSSCLMLRILSAFMARKQSFTNFTFLSDSPKIFFIQGKIKLAILGLKKIVSWEPQTWQLLWQLLCIVLLQLENFQGSCKDGQGLQKRFQFIFIYIASLAIEIVSRYLREAQGLNPIKKRPF